MSRRPRCFLCGRGLSARHDYRNMSMEERVIIVVFAPIGWRGPICVACADEFLQAHADAKP